MSNHIDLTTSNLEIFLMSDQPTTCPKCGLRTELLISIYDSVLEEQINVCLSSICGFVFLTTEN